MIAENLARVLENIHGAVKRRRAAAFDSRVKLIAVTKNHDISAMREAIDAGAATVGENRVQEALQKRPLLERDVHWHLIGHLQTNKVRQAVPLFDLIHSLDSLRLGGEIDRAARKLGKVQDVLLQVNVAGEESKSGVELKEVVPFARALAGLEHVRLCGLMTMAPYDENPEAARPVFRALYQAFMELRSLQLEHAAVEWLSMGMTNDYVVAVEEGANMVRVGTGIFGERRY